MQIIQEFVGLQGLSNDDFVSAGTDVLCVGDIIHGFTSESGVASTHQVTSQNAAKAILSNPVLAVGIVLLARLERIHYDLLENQNITHQLLQKMGESTCFSRPENNCDASKYHANAWLVSDVALKELAESLGVKTKTSDTWEDYRYRVAKKLAENAANLDSKDSA